jgi:predicted DNA binding protein/putative methionine-R-sulfoxide reductase with GAF domain
MQGTVVISRDVTERKRQQDQLERLTRIQQLIHESVGALTSATTKTEIERSVCERLANSPFYEFAWIGSRDPSSHEVTPESYAGIEAGYLDDITVTVDPSDSGQGPVGRAYRSGDVAVVPDVDADPDFTPWREAALERGFRSVAAVPLVQGSTTHGVLVVYADRPNAFSDRELAGFQTLGETVGFALSAAQNRRLLESETVLELEFLTRHVDDTILDATATTDSRFVFEGAVSSGDDATLCYLTVEGLDLSCAANALAAAERVVRHTRLDGTDGPDFEVTLRDDTYQLLADAGARGTRVVVENGVSRVFAEAPADMDARTVRDALATAVGDVELVARRETDPADTRWFPTEGNLGARLTDRQRSVLRAAFYSGYYEWPRETDAEGLAESLDVATSTTLQHLRKGHKAVMRSLFDS